MPNHRAAQHGAVAHVPRDGGYVVLDVHDAGRERLLNADLQAALGQRDLELRCGVHDFDGELCRVFAAVLVFDRQTHKEGTVVRPSVVQRREPRALSDDAVPQVPAVSRDGV